MGNKKLECDRCGERSHVIVTPGMHWATRSALSKDEKLETETEYCKTCFYARTGFLFP